MFRYPFIEQLFDSFQVIAMIFADDGYRPDKGKFARVRWNEVLGEYHRLGHSTGPRSYYQDINFAVIPFCQPFAGESPQVETAFVFFQAVPPLAHGFILGRGFKRNRLSIFTLCEHRKGADQLAGFQPGNDGRSMRHYQTCMLENLGGQ